MVYWGCLQFFVCKISCSWLLIFHARRALLTAGFFLSLRVFSVRTVDGLRFPVYKIINIVQIPGTGKEYALWAK